jgi:hypothetical protein
MSIIDWSNLLTISMCAGGDPDKSGNVSTSTNAAGLIWKTMVTVWQSFLERLPLLIAGLIFLALTWVVTYIFNKSAFRILSRFDLKQSHYYYMDCWYSHLGPNHIPGPDSIQSTGRSGNRVHRHWVCFQGHFREFLRRTVNPVAISLRAG